MRTEYIVGVFLNNQGQLASYVQQESLRKGCDSLTGREHFTNADRVRSVMFTDGDITFRTCKYCMYDLY